eukprot:symbB.v1.2.032470.t1/scaffold3898.1/size48671/2
MGYQRAVECLLLGAHKLLEKEAATKEGERAALEKSISQDLGRSELSNEVLNRLVAGLPSGRGAGQRRPEIQARRRATFEASAGSGESYFVRLVASAEAATLCTMSVYPCLCAAIRCEMMHRCLQRGSGSRYASEAGLSDPWINALKHYNMGTFSKLSFAITTPGTTAQDADIRTFLGGIRPGINPTIADMSAFKRIFFEAQTLMIHNLKTVVKGEEGGIRRMAPPEREARLTRQRALLRGIDISGPLEPAHALYDLCTSMIEKNQISYISPARCLSRQQELAGAKPDKELQLDSTKTTLVLKEQQPKMEISVASDLALYQAIQRRSLALDLRVMRSWTDRHLLRLGELHTGPVKPGPGPGKLLDPLVGRLEHDVSVTYFMLPLPVQSTTPGDKGDKGDKPTKRKNDGPDDAGPKRPPVKIKKGAGKGKRDPATVDGPDVIFSLALYLMKGLRKCGKSTELKGRALDLSSAYRQLAIHDESKRFAYLAIFNPKLGRASLFQQVALPFGSKSAVHAFIRCARFLQWLAARCLALPMSCYFDDFVSFTTPALAMNTQASLCLMLDVFGWAFDKEGPKSDDFSSSVAALGVIVDLSYTATGRLLVGNTQKRLHESIEFVHAVVKANKLTKKDALTLRGRLGYCDAFIFGRIGKVALQNITRHAYAQPFSAVTDQHLTDSLILLEDRLAAGVPRCFDLMNVHRTFFLFTDASFDPVSGAGIGAVLFDDTGALVEWFGFLAPVGELSTLLKDDRETVICELEAIAVVLAMLIWGSITASSRLMVYIDKEGARFSPIKGYSKSYAITKICVMAGILLDGNFCFPWFGRVPSLSNIADFPSRLINHPMLICSREHSRESVVAKFKESLDLLAAADSPHKIWDRPDPQVATRTLAQVLQRPTVKHFTMLKRLARREYYSLVSGASNLLGEVSTALDWGMKTENQVFMDASAGISMGSRRGLGKATHVDTQYHWVQERVAQKYFKIKKVGTNDMLADVLTKPVTEDKMNRALRGMNFHFLDGKHQLTVKT